MNGLTAAEAGRIAVLAAVLMQAAGKVVYGTMLTAIPSQLFVFISITITAGLFLTLGRKGVGIWAWKTLAVLNVCTAIAFLSLFHALKLIEPAIAVAVNIGLGPLVTVLAAWLFAGERPSRHRLLVCAGIIAGCAVLCLSAVWGAGLASSSRDAWLGLAASVATGATGALITVSSRKLVEKGWRSGAILAHRFYLVFPAALLLSLGSGPAASDWTSGLAMLVLVVALATVTVPTYLFQFAIRRCDPYTVMVTMSALPVATFAVEGLSPAYRWSWTTAAGLCILTSFLLLDIYRSRRRVA